VKQALDNSKQFFLGTLLYQQKQIHRLIERVTELDILQTIMCDWILHLNQQQSSQHNRI
jgi:hypothetical protein